MLSAKRRVWAIPAVIVVTLSGVAYADTQYVPGIVLSERYDSNILRRPSNAIPAGLSKDDIVTSLFPRVLVRSRGGLVDVNGMIGAIGELHALNPELNYVGMRGAAGLGLTPLVSRLTMNMTLNLSGTVSYSPTQPAFLRPDQTSPFFAGIQYFRNNTLNYSVGGTSVYTTGPTTFVQSSYRYNKIKFFEPNAVQGNALLNTTNQQVTVSPGLRISPNDTINMSYLGNFYDQPGRGTYRTHAGTLGWLRNWSQNLFTQISGGGKYIEPRTVTIGGTTNLPGSVIPTGSVAIIYGENTQILGDIVGTSRRLMDLEMPLGEDWPEGMPSAGRYNVRLAYTYRAFPLLTQNGGLIKGHVLGMTGNIGLTSQLSLFGGGNFSKNTSIGGQFNFEAISGNVGVSYLIAPALMANVQYIYYNSYSFAGAGNFPPLNRQSAMVTLTYTFEGGSQFFQGNGFGQGFFGSQEQPK